MKDRITNQIDMIGACIALADKPEYIALWTGQQPADFESDLNTVRSEYGAIRSASSTAYASTTGAADAKAQAETGLEDAAYVLARACAAHFKRIGDLTRLAKVDFSKSAIVRLRDQALVTTATLIRDQANTAQNTFNPDGSNPQSITTVSPGDHTAGRR